MILDFRRRGCKFKQAVFSRPPLRLRSVRLHQGRSSMAEALSPYSEWSQQSLVERVEHLEKQLREQTQRSVLLGRSLRPIC